MRSGRISVKSRPGIEENPGIGLWSAHGRHEQQAPRERASGATHDRPSYLKCQHLGFFERLLAIDQPARPKAESVLSVNVCS